MPDLGLLLAGYGALLSTIVGFVQVRAFLRERPRLELSADILTMPAPDSGRAAQRVRLGVRNVGAQPVYIVHAALLAGSNAAWESVVAWRVEPFTAGVKELLPTAAITVIPGRPVSQFVATDSGGRRWTKRLGREWLASSEPAHAGAAPPEGH